MADSRAVSVIDHTVMDGVVVRWYERTEGVEIASASRNAVLFYGEDVPARVRDAALGAHKELARSRTADVRHYATHVRESLFGPLIAKGGEPK